MTVSVLNNVARIDYDGQTLLRRPEYAGCINWGWAAIVALDWLYGPEKVGAVYHPTYSFIRGECHHLSLQIGTRCSCGLQRVDETALTQLVPHPDRD